LGFHSARFTSEFIGEDGRLKKRLRLRLNNDDNMIEIESGIPIPEPKWSSKKYPIKEMEVGDSFFAPGRKSTTMHPNFHRYKPRKFRCRKEGDGVRVWRVE
jgi:hypothetical protein